MISCAIGNPSALAFSKKGMAHDRSVDGVFYGLFVDECSHEQSFVRNPRELVSLLGAQSATSTPHQNCAIAALRGVVHLGTAFLTHKHIALLQKSSNKRLKSSPTGIKHLKEILVQLIYSKEGRWCFFNVFISISLSPF